MNCKNCNVSITNEDNFCPSCGEKTTFKRLTIKSFTANFLNQFLGIENKLYKTFKELFTQPELVINSYIEGFRKKYVNVISYLGLAITLIGLQFFILKKLTPEVLIGDFQNNNSQGLDMQSIMNLTYDYQGFIAIASIPFYALISRFVFIDSKKYNVAEHFVIITYSSAQLFIAWFFLIMATLPFGFNYSIISSFLLIPMFIYMVYVYKRLYNFSLKSIILRTSSYIIMSLFLPIIIGIFIAIYMLIINNS